ncbi:hypothetical protein NUW54_g7601 [Trametes sanguinea]|uniref:Uncharacterized protein n=1 Tax=Trametes sanguinea TaxID=158606 RepID=A0ACC1PKI0_9APHY|nr:hypothetical protein NUW54_g7601 [Trametes sanguinea]
MRPPMVQSYSGWSLPRPSEYGIPARRTSRIELWRVYLDLRPCRLVLPDCLRMWSCLRPLAPRLWHCSKDEGVGMYVVVMDRIADTEERMMTEEDHATLREAIALLHEHNLVFGDLREPNVLLVKGGGLMLVDFDWCGQEGAAKYPGDMNDDGSIPWAQDAEAGQLIKKEHDLHMLTMLARED